MKFKLILAFAAIVLCATCGQAQQGGPAVAHGTGPTWAGGGGGFSGSLGGGSWSGYGGLMGRPVTFEPPKQYFIEYAKNDGPFVPSTFMNYEDALKLGRQQLAEFEAQSKGEGEYSLGAIARAYRAEKVPTFRLKTRVAQDNAGNLQVCNLNGNDCRKL